MKPRVIANPPIGIYTNPTTTINHSSFLVLLDAIARYKSKFNREEISFPGRSYNLYGKRADFLFEKEINHQDYSEISSIHKKVISKDSARNKLNLSSLELLTEEESVITEGCQRDFLKLYKEGYLIKKDNKFYLDCSKVAKKRDLKGMLEEINFHPKRIKAEMMRLIEKNTDNPVLITRDTRYAIKNPLGGDNIGPLFTLSNLWDYKYPNHDVTMAGSNSVLAKYIFLRFLTRSAIDDSPGMDELIIWPKIIFEGGINEWDLDKIIKDKYQGDMLRFSLLSSYTEKEQKINMKKSRFLSGRNFVYSFLNLRRPLAGEYRKTNGLLPEYAKKIENFDFPLLFDEFRKKLKGISLAVNKNKDEDNWNKFSKSELAKEYINIVEALEPFIPETTSLVKESVKYG